MKQIACEYCFADPGQRDPHITESCPCDCHPENKAYAEREHFIQLHNKINSRSAHKLYEAYEKLDLEFQHEQLMDMSGDAQEQIQKHKEEAIRHLYRYYGLKSWQEWADLMEDMYCGYSVPNELAMY